MELALWRPRLQDILVRDADRATAVATIPAVQAMWQLIRQTSDAADICKAALVYSLSETTVLDETGIPRAKWELTRIAPNPFFEPNIDDPDEELLPYSATWQEFCLVHLGMAKSTASKYKRVWAVFNKKLGYGLDDLYAAGVFKLGISVGLVDKMIKDGAVKPRLVIALFGSPTTCSACDGYVPGETPIRCPHCDTAYQGAQPWSGPRTLLLVQQLRGKKEEESAPLDVFASLEHFFDEAGNVAGFSVLAECAAGETKSSLPPWEVNVVPDSAPPDELGVRQAHLQSLESWLRRKFPGA